MPTDPIAIGAAIFSVRTGFFVSLRAYLAVRIPVEKINSRLRMTYIVGVGVSDERPDDVVQSHNNTITAASCALKRILKVMRRLSLGMTG
jgi:hypothetical protein